VGYLGVEAFYPQNLLFAKALPDPDLRYFSNSTAFDSFENPIYVTSLHGLNLDVWGDLPSLWAFRRSEISEVMPM